MSATTLPASAVSDWRLEIPESRRRQIRIWLWSIAACTVAVLVVGGITRLTLSGLSIVDWQPIMGVIPPLGEAQWQETFARYQQFPQYETWPGGMTLAEFKFIFFWEYLHRLLARLIGLVFLVPFIFFWRRGDFNPPLVRRALLLFALGAMQGVMGWVMVRSGLVDRPSVSHYRLAAHLTLAFAIFGFALWLTRELGIERVRRRVSAATRRTLLRGLGLVGFILGIQIIWGAFVAGLKAGMIHGTFPLMAGALVPPDLLRLDPLARNFVENPGSVQWLHRLLGTLLLVATLAFFFTVSHRDVDARSRQLNVALLALVCAQYLLGVLTLLLAVPVALGVLHQLGALAIFGVWLVWVHHLRNADVSHG